MKIKHNQQKLEGCQCEQCEYRRERFLDYLEALQDGIGVKSQTIDSNMSKIPEKFLEHMRDLLKTVNRENPDRHHFIPQDFPTFCRKFKAPLRQLKNDYYNPHKVFKVRKRKLDGTRGREPMLVAIAKMVQRNPDYFIEYIKNMSFHD